MLTTATIDDLSKLLTSDQFTLRGNQLQRIVEILTELQQEKAAASDLKDVKDE